MSETLDLDHLRQWIGRSAEATDVVTAHLVMGLRATLFQEVGEPKDGDAAPFTVHWCLAQPVFPMSMLGPDGHPTRGGFLPPVPLPRRMWAGGELEFFDALRVGDAPKRTSRISDVTVKTGSTGTLCFVAVEHVVTTPRGTAIRERQDIVYRDMGSAQASPAKAPPPPPVAKHRESAYGRSGAAVSLLGADLQRPPHPLRPRLRHQGRGLSRADLPRPAAGGLHRRTGGEAAWRHAAEELSYRGVQPLFEGAEFSVNANDNGGGLELWTANAEGQPTMKGTATW